MIFRKNDDYYDEDDKKFFGIIDSFNENKIIIIALGIFFMGIIITVNVLTHKDSNDVVDSGTDNVVDLETDKDVDSESDKEADSESDKDVDSESDKDVDSESDEVVKNYLKLNGDKTITVLRGTDFEDPGFEAYNSKNEDLKSFVKINSTLNIEKIGTYKITYSLYDIVVTRKVNVIANSNEKTEIILNTFGNDETTDVYLLVGEKYKEPGYKVVNSLGKNLQNNVTITGNIDTSRQGTYELTYSLTDPNGRVIKVKRKVIVMDIKITLSKNTEQYTNKNVGISVRIEDSYFDYLELPNKEKIKVKSYTYTVSENGTYTFTVYNKKGYTKSASINVNNIDKIAPSGSCSGSYKNRKTTINISSSDNIGISKYVMNGTTYTNNKIVLGKKISSANITIYDKVGNTKQISCNIVDNSYLAPIKPGSGETIVKQNETDTLKIYITKKGSYYITRIWAYDPYYQLNKKDSPEYGSNLYKPKDLLQFAINDNNLDNKLIVGFNASGFYLKNTYDAASVSKYSGYDKTSVGTLVITDGKVIRNVYDKAYKTWYIAGVDSSNTLKVFTDSMASTTTEINTKKQWASSVINSGIRNTFTFASPLVMNGVKSDITTSMPSSSSKVNRQAICQVNSNNFVLITGSQLSRNNLIEIMLGLNCQTGTNLDGGGSIALLFKEPNNSTITTIIGNSRNLTEVGYFTELKN